ncbi:MAG TPA: type IV toxin-antitoxin system AbiEi family antitoxin domain-containing protein [Thermomicrobiales bacterium]|nr:type IV toxin-antitoxin system AbiEi family antitoxin domain-containing protein [Thermomicrobiales bacterium]
MGAVLALARERGYVRPRDLAVLGVSRPQLARLVRRGLLERVGYGLYRAPDAPITEHHTLAQVAARAPGGVACLLTALRFHGLTTQNPFEVWLAVGRQAARPQLDGLPVRVVYFSGAAFVAGIEEHRVDNVRVRVYCPAKTVADCFKYRNKVGLDVALEALRETWRARRATMDDLWRYATICRVANVMRPYLETLG